MPSPSAPQRPLALLLLFCAAASARVADLSGRSHLTNFRGPHFEDWCDETDDCVIDDSHLECRNKKCVCQDGFEYSDGFCRKDASASFPQPPRLGDWCEDSSDCADVGAHMECRSAVCECSEGFVLAHGSCEIRTGPLVRPKSLLPGDMCSITEDCAVIDDNLECRTGVCLCKEGYSLSEGICKEVTSTVASTTARSPRPGDVCNENEDCNLVDENLICKIGACHCKEAYTLRDGLCRIPEDPVSSSTPRSSHLGNWCVIDDDCGAAEGNLECFGGMCLCKEGYVPNDGQCETETRPVVTSTTTRHPRPATPPLLGDWCTDNLDCALTDDNMECFSEVCLCKQGYVQREGLCKKEINALGPHWSWTGEKASTSIIGELCEEMSDCAPDQNVECRRGYCECTAGYSEHEGSCKKKITKIGAPCNETTDVCYLEEEDGGAKTACVQGKCLCKQGFVLDNGRCKKYITKLGARCHPDLHICFLEADGNDTKTECRDGACQCKDGYEESDGMCAIGVVNKELGASCQNDRACSGILHARCNDMGKCACIEGYGPMNNKTCGKRVGDRCDDGVCDALNTQCTKKRSSRNEASVCACKKFHLSSSNRTYCYTWPQIIGDLCDQSPNCMFLGENVECLEGRCQCREEFTFQDGMCVDKMSH